MIHKSANAEEWMGLEPQAQTIIGLEQSFDKQNNHEFSLNLSSSLGEHFWLDLAHSQYDIEDQSNTFQSKQYSGQISWLVNNTTELRLAYQFDGEKDVLEVNQTQYQFIYKPYPWTIALHYYQGDVGIYTRDNLPLLSTVPDSLLSDFSTTGVELAWWFDDFTLSFKQLDYDFEKDLSLIASRPRLQQIIKAEALIHSALLITQNQTLSIEIPFQQRTFIVDYQHITSAVDKATSKLVTINWHEDLTTKIRLISRFSQTLNSSNTWLLAFGLEWSL